MRGSVLILVNERGDRRKLFELLDGQDFEAIFAAKDVTQARSMLASEDALDLIVLEFGSADFEVRALADEIAGSEMFSKVPVIGVIPGSLDAVFGIAPPKNVTAWISSPVDPQGALTVIERALMPPEMPSEAAIDALPTTTSGGLGSYRFAFDASLDEMILSDPVTGKVVDANQTFVTQSGMSLSDVIGRPVDDLDLTHKAQVRRDLIQHAMRQGTVRYRGQVPRGDGTRLTVDAHIRLVRADGEVRLLSCFRAQTADPNRRVFGDFVDGLWAARGSENLARNLTQKLVDYAKLDFVLLIAKRTELGEGHDLVVSQMRPGFSAGLIEQLKGPVLRKVLDGEAFLANTNAWKALGAAGQEEKGRIEMLFGVLIRDERQVVIGGLLGAGRESFGEEAGVANWVRALSARVALELEIERAQELGRAKGLQDSLTSLPNRLLFNDRLETTIKEAHRTGEMFAVLFVDLDRFKNVNDSLGHSVGDELLIAVGKRLRSCLRGSDTVARYAGDEFTLILRHIVQREDVLRIAEKICRVLEPPLTLNDGRELQITASIGISFYPDDADSAETLLMHADIAMYNAKGMGRNNFQTYVAVPEESHQQRLAWKPSCGLPSEMANCVRTISRRSTR
ncbi:MAG: sensor domain-containing diguanylate cyclase [Ahniella sp.]|nr:sensor domain-containing diguanylate cyclase [Ahniella sp.]